MWLEGEILFLDLWIHEVAVHDVIWEKPILGVPSTSNSVPPLRISMLWHCLAAAKAYQTGFLRLS